MATGTYLEVVAVPDCGLQEDPDREGETGVLDLVEGGHVVELDGLSALDIEGLEELGVGRRHGEERGGLVQLPVAFAKSVVNL
jgi:hypothetical protein